MYVALILLLVAVGSVVFHFASPWWWTPIASNWGYVDTTIVITFWITGVVFVGVIIFMAWCLWRYRYRPEKRAAYEPENKKLEVWLTVLTAIGVAGMLTPGLFVWSDFVNVPEGAAEYEVMGQQWQWSFRYPGEDGALGPTDPKFISYENVFGIDPDDPRGQDDVVVEFDDMHLPLDRPVKVLLRSIDVLHDFYVPQFRAKMDLVPGMITYFWLTPTREGRFEILCAELCGVGHHAMRGNVVIESEDAFQAWLGEQQTFAEVMAQARNDSGEALKLVSSEDNATAR